MIKDIYFAGGCFWGAQEYFSRVPGVISATSGYANSLKANPSYEEVCSGKTNAAETVKVEYNPDKINLAALIKRYFSIINPFTLNRQGNDAGTQYRTGIYYTNPEQKDIIDEVYQMEQGHYGVPLAVEVKPLDNFYRAEEYHQDYLKKNPNGYCHINLNTPARAESAVDAARYPRPDEEMLRKNLPPEVFSVTQQAATEPAFSGKYWNNHDKGIYVDAVTGEPLFSSSDKFDSGTGWPSFTKAVDSDVILGQVDNSHGMSRIEAISRSGRSHLGHIFPDGPSQAGGQRFCINSAALRFIPFADMDKEGYGYLKQLIKD